MNKKQILSVLIPLSVCTAMCASLIRAEEERTSPASFEEETAVQEEESAAEETNEEISGEEANEEIWEEVEMTEQTAGQLAGKEEEAQPDIDLGRNHRRGFKVGHQR